MNNPLDNSVLVASKRRKGGKERDNPSAKPLGIRTFATSVIIQNRFMLKYELRFASFRDLLGIVTHWIDNHTGLSLYGVYVANDTSGKTFEAVRQRVRLLIKKGLVEDLSIGNVSAYIPTDKAIKELSELCEGV